MCGIVVIESVTICGVAPGVIVADGAKEGFASVGMPDALNITELENVPFEDETVKAKFAVCPAVIEVVELGAVTE